jgi:lysine-specific demethylase 8
MRRQLGFFRNGASCGRRRECSRTISTTAISEETIRTEEDSQFQDLLAEKITPYYREQSPVVLRGAVANTNAVSEWKSWDYLQRTVDQDAICHVEIGGNYSASMSDRSDIRFQDFIMYMQLFEERRGRSLQQGVEAPESGELVYLAQNDVTPELYKDFDVPSFCGDANSLVGHAGRLYNTMLWVGPYGCVSPMHNDPLDNVLMQFVGVKEAWLFPPDDATALYAGHDGNQPNTSPINPDATDLVRYPLLAGASSAVHCILGPGDLLYIPKRWFHYIQTIETSISVNAWWR